MRTILIFGIASLSLSLPTADHQWKIRKFKPGGEARWTGTITMEEKIEGEFVRSEKKVTVSFVNTLPTLFRDTVDTELNFTDDKGTGTVTFHGDAYNLGKKVGYTDCSGSGQAQLHEVVVDEYDNQYHISVIGPDCTGESVSLLTGDRDPYGPEKADIVITNERLIDKNLLSGSRTEVFDIGGDLGKLTRTLQWRLERSREDVVLIVTPVDYDNWMPEPGRDENTVGKIMTVNLKLQRRDGQPPLMKAKAFELFLSNSSKEPGITINFPINPGTPKPDLRFLLPLTTLSEESGGQSLRINCQGACLTGTVKIGAYDGGGWTTLKAVAILQNDTRVIGNLLVPGGEQEILIPKRDVDSKIATAWLIPNGNPSDMDDNDQSQGNRNNGDGLTAYEEYRGVISKGKYIKLDPKKKEAGVRIKRAELTLFDNGMTWLEKAADIKVIRFFETEINNDRKLNRNFIYGHTYDQYVQKLEKGSISGDAVGENQPITTLNKLPAQSDLVLIDITKIKNSYRSQSAAAAAAHVRLPYTEAEQIANTVAHELAHGINADHHGPPSNQPNITIPVPSVDIYHVYGSDGIEIPITRPYPIQGLIGTGNNDESGDTSCIMTYTSLYQWAFRVGRNGSLNYYAVPLLPMGRNLCTSNAGNGMNANDKYFGDARTGNCLGRIKLK